MRIKIYLPVVMLTALVVLSILIWRDLDATRAAEIARAAIRAKDADLSAERMQAEQRLATAERERDGAKAALTTLLVPTPVKPASAKPAMRTGNTLDVIRNEPDAEASYIAGRRANLAASYGPLLRRLKLTPAAVVKFQDAFIRREEDRMDLAAALAAQGVDAND